MNDHRSEPKGTLLAQGRQGHSMPKRNEIYAKVQELINDGQDLHHIQSPRVAEIAHRVMVMYAGWIEHADIVQLFTQRGIPIAAA